MNDLEMIVARGIEVTVPELSQYQKRALNMAIVKEIRANADVVRVDMEHEVWGMVR